MAEGISNFLIEIMLRLRADVSGGLGTATTALKDIETMSARAASGADAATASLKAQVAVKAEALRVEQAELGRLEGALRAAQDAERGFGGTSVVSAAEASTSALRALGQQVQADTDDLLRLQSVARTGLSVVAPVSGRSPETVLPLTPGPSPAAQVAAPQRVALAAETAGLVAPPIRVPPVEVPVLVSKAVVPTIDVPRISVPPTEARITVPPVEVPRVVVPPIDIPKVTLPAIEVPKLLLPVETERPVITAPEVPRLFVPVEVQRPTVPATDIPRLVVPTEVVRPIVPAVEPPLLRVPVEVVPPVVPPIVIPKAVVPEIDIPRPVVPTPDVPRVTVAVETQRPVILPPEAPRVVLPVEVLRPIIPAADIPKLVLPVEALRPVIQAPDIPRVVIPVEVQRPTILPFDVPRETLRVEVERPVVPTIEPPRLVVPVEVQPGRVPPIETPRVLVPIEVARGVVPPIAVPSLLVPVVVEQGVVPPIPVPRLVVPVEVATPVVPSAAIPRFALAPIDVPRLVIPPIEARVVVQPIEVPRIALPPVEVPGIVVPVELARPVLPAIETARLVIPTELQKPVLPPVEVPRVFIPVEIQRPLVTPPELPRLTLPVSVERPVVPFVEVRPIVIPVSVERPVVPSIAPSRVEVVVDVPRVVVPPVEVVATVVPPAPVRVLVEPIVSPPIEVPRVALPPIEAPRIILPSLEVPPIRIPPIELPRLILPVEVARAVVAAPEVPRVVVPVEVQRGQVPPIEVPKVVVPVEVLKPVIPTTKLPPIQQTVELFYGSAGAVAFAAEGLRPPKPVVIPVEVQKPAIPPFEVPKIVIPVEVQGFLARPFKLPAQFEDNFRLAQAPVAGLTDNLVALDAELANKVAAATAASKAFEQFRLMVTQLTAAIVELAGAVAGIGRVSLAPVEVVKSIVPSSETPRLFIPVEVERPVVPPAEGLKPIDIPVNVERPVVEPFHFVIEPLHTSIIIDKPIAPTVEAITFPPPNIAPVLAANEQIVASLETVRAATLRELEASNANAVSSAEFGALRRQAFRATDLSELESVQTRLRALNAEYANGAGVVRVYNAATSEAKSPVAAFDNYRLSVRELNLAIKQLAETQRVANSFGPEAAAAQAALGEKAQVVAMAIEKETLALKANAEAWGVDIGVARQALSVPQPVRGIGASRIGSAVQTASMFGGKPGMEGFMGGVLAEGLGASIPVVAGLTIGITALAGAFELLKKGAEGAAGIAKFTHEMENLSAQTGLSVHDIEAFSKVAELKGVDTSSLRQGFRILNEEIAKGSPLLAALGIKTHDPKEAFLQLADAFAASKDGADKTAVSQQLMGARLGSLVPFLNMSRDGILAVVAALDAQNAVLSESTFVNYEALTKKSMELQISQAGLANSWTVLTLPALSASVDAMQKMADKSRELVAALDRIKLAGIPASEVLSGLVGILADVGIGVATLSAAIAGATFAPVLTGVAALVASSKGLFKVWEDGRATIDAVLAKMHMGGLPGTPPKESAAPTAPGVPGAPIEPGVKDAKNDVIAYGLAFSFLKTQMKDTTSVTPEIQKMADAVASGKMSVEDVARALQSQPEGLASFVAAWKKDLEEMKRSTNEGAASAKAYGTALSETMRHFRDAGAGLEPLSGAIDKLNADQKAGDWTSFSKDLQEAAKQAHALGLATSKADGIKVVARALDEGAKAADAFNKSMDALVRDANRAALGLSPLDDAARAFAHSLAFEGSDAAIKKLLATIHELQPELTDLEANTMAKGVATDATRQYFQQELGMKHLADAYHMGAVSAEEYRQILEALVGLDLAPNLKDAAALLARPLPPGPIAPRGIPVPTREPPWTGRPMMQGEDLANQVNVQARQIRVREDPLASFRAHLKDLADFSKQGTATIVQAFDAMAGGIGSAFADALFGMKSFTDAFAELMKQIIAMIIEMFAKLVVAQVFLAVFGIPLPAAALSVAGSLEPVQSTAPRATTGTPPALSNAANGASGQNVTINATVNALDIGTATNALRSQFGVLRKAFEADAERSRI